MLESLTKIFNDFEPFKNEIFTRVEKYFEFKSEITGGIWAFEYDYNINEFLSFEFNEDGLYINFKKPGWGSESYFMPSSYFEKNWEENMKKDIERDIERERKKLLTMEEKEKKELERLKKKYDDDEGSLDKTDEKLTKAACQKLIDTLRLPISRAN
ncbi:MAG: hypothetical protein GY870_05265, partial [archaeon]|nr:hypothetical protein [archaeon]